MGKESSAQMSLDFMIGIGVFLLAFMFVFAFIPGLFVPFISNSDELTMTADRTAAALVDDTLALRDSCGVHPDILDASRISAFSSSMGNVATYQQVRGSLGLNMSGSALYSLEVVIDWENGSTQEIFNGGDRSSGISGNVGQSKRFVYVRDPSNPGDYPGTMAVLKVRVW